MVEVAEQYAQLPLAAIVESPLNPRKTFNQHRMTDLEASIREQGIITPLIVRPAGEGYEIAAGHRRFRAARAVGLATVPARIREYTDEQFMEVLITENLQREDVHPLEEAAAYREILARPGMDIPALVLRVGKSETYVRQRLKLLDLREELQKRFLAGDFTFSHALLLARLEPVDQKKAAVWLDDRQGGVISAQELKRVIERTFYLNIVNAPFDLSDAGLVPKAGACTGCAKRSGYMPKLWPEFGKDDICLDRGCYERKCGEHASNQLKRLKKEQGKPALAISAENKWNSEIKKGIVHAGDYRVLESGKECPSAEKAVVMEVRYSRDKLTVGQVANVCANKKCAVHHQAYRHEARQVSAADKLTQAEEELARAVVSARLEHEVALAAQVAEKHPVMDGEAFGALVVSIYERCGQELRAAISVSRGYPKPTWQEDLLVAEIQRLSPAEQWGLLNEIAMRQGAVMADQALSEYWFSKVKGGEAELQRVEDEVREKWEKKLAKLRAAAEGEKPTKKGKGKKTA